jgi:hypothetical protein
MYIPSLFISITPKQIVALLEKAPDLLLNNLDRFFGNEHFRDNDSYRILRNSETTPEEKIKAIKALTRDAPAPLAE